MTATNHLYKSESIILDRDEVYDAKSMNIWPFKRVHDIIDGIELNLSNMTTAYPFEVNGTQWRSSEQLYLCGEFSNDTEAHKIIQASLIESKSPFAAKHFIKMKYQEQVREDFVEFRSQWMLWVVWKKCQGNIDFRSKLLSIPDDVVLVEDTTNTAGGTSRIWGCLNRELSMRRKAIAKSIAKSHHGLSKSKLDRKISVEVNSVRDIGVFTGQNNMGKILMICRDCLKQGIKPNINEQLLESKNIFILGERISFLD